MDSIAATSALPQIPHSHENQATSGSGTKSLWKQAANTTTQLAYTRSTQQDFPVHGYSLSELKASPMPNNTIVILSGVCLSKDKEETAFLPCRLDTLSLIAHLKDHSEKYFNSNTVLKNIKALEIPLSMGNNTFTTLSSHYFGSLSSCDTHTKTIREGELHLLTSVVYRHIQNDDEETGKSCVCVDMKLIGRPKNECQKSVLGERYKPGPRSLFSFTFAIHNESEILPTRKVASNLRKKGICKHVSLNVLKQLYSAINNPNIKLITQYSIRMGTVKFAYPLCEYYKANGESLRDTDVTRLSDGEVQGIYKRPLGKRPFQMDEGGFCKAPHSSVPLKRLLEQYDFKEKKLQHL